MTENTNRTVRHLILCRFRPEVSVQRVGEFFDHFRALALKIPGIVGFEFGPNNSPEGLNRGMTHACLLTFESAQARDAYLPHPEHRRFVAEDTGIIAEILVFDYSPLD